MERGLRQGADEDGGFFGLNEDLELLGAAMVVEWALMVCPVDNSCVAMDHILEIVAAHRRACAPPLLGRMHSIALVVWGVHHLARHRFSCAGSNGGGGLRIMYCKRRVLLARENPLPCKPWCWHVCWLDSDQFLKRL